MAGTEPVVPADSSTVMEDRWSFRWILSLLVLSCAGCSSALTTTHYKELPQQQLIEAEAGIAAVQGKITPPSGQRIRAAIVPHHLTASETIAAGTAMLRGSQAKRIVLLSPDHFNACTALLCTTNGTFAVPSGLVRTDEMGIREFLRSPDTAFQPSLFEREHGIQTIIPFLAQDLSDIPILPIVVTADFRWRSGADRILSAIQKIVDDDTLLMVSSDFSHYLKTMDADKMDDATAMAIFAKDMAGVAGLHNPDQSDCPSCLWVLARIAEDQNFYNPSVIRHTNSARILGEPQATNTTSHFAMVWYQNASLNSGDSAFAGDVTVTRRAPGSVPKLSRELRAFWSGTGARIVNLEGPLAETCVPERNMYSFCNLASTWRQMKGLATHWGIMNNHMLDLWYEGIEVTRHTIREDGELAITTDLLHSPNLHVVALTALINPVADRGLYDLSAHAEHVRAQVRKEPPGPLTVVFVHSGDEYHALTSAAHDAYLQSFIDAGADAVIEAHSHIQGDIFFYKNKPIFRGIGNFIFDQPDDVATSTAKIVRLRKVEDHIALETLIER